MIQGESRVKSEVESEDLTTGIRIDVDTEVNDLLDEWAKQEGRSKREHVRVIVRKLAKAYAKDPLILELIAFHSAGKAQLVPSTAA